MEYKHYLDIFQKAADQINVTILQRKQAEVTVGEVLNSVFLKIYKKSWTTPSQDLLKADSRIFFSIWVNDSTLAKKRIFYNIHALKLRHLKAYRIQSKKFAETFRKRFKHHEHNWQNVSVTFGPLTLMEGWKRIDPENLQSDILELANRFLEIDHLIDDTLTELERSFPNQP